jgi:hypothetical protein
VVHKLPVILQTLWFRLMGRGEVQQRAMADVAALPDEHVYRYNALRESTTSIVLFPSLSFKYCWIVRMLLSIITFKAGRNTFSLEAGRPLASA